MGSALSPGSWRRGTAILGAAVIVAGSGIGGWFLSHPGTRASCSVLAPASGASVVGSTSYEAACGANTSRADFLVDGQSVGFALKSANSALYKITWDSSQVGDGTHALTVTSVGTSGASYTSSSRSVTTANGVTSNCEVRLSNYDSSSSTGSPTGNEAGTGFGGSLQYCELHGPYITFEAGTYARVLATGTGSTTLTLNGTGATLQPGMNVNWSNMTIEHFTFSPLSCSSTTDAAGSFTDLCTRSTLAIGVGAAVSGDTITSNTFDGTTEPQAGTQLKYTRDNSTSQTITYNVFTRCGDPDPGHYYTQNEGTGICTQFANTTGTLTNNTYTDYCYGCKDLNGKFNNSTVAYNYFGKIVHYSDPVTGVVCYESTAGKTTTLTSALGAPAAGTHDTIFVADGATNFPSTANFAVRITNGANVERVRVIAGMGTNTWTVIRGIEGTTPLATVVSGTVLLLDQTCAHMEHWFMAGMTGITVNANTFADCGYNDGGGPLGGAGDNGGCTGNLTIAGNDDIDYLIENNKFIGRGNSGVILNSYDVGDSNGKFVNNLCESGVDPCFDATHSGWPTCGITTPAVTCIWTVANNVSVGRISSSTSANQRFDCYANVQGVGSWSGNCAGGGNVATSSGIALDANNDPTAISTALIGLANVTFAPASDFYGHLRDGSPDIGPVEYGAS